MPEPCSALTCVVMPVYNEEATISTVLDAVRRHFDGWVVVVDDGSTDSTEALVSVRTDVLLCEHGDNRGYGASLRTGFEAALRLGASTVITMDCDGQHEPRHITEFCDRIRTCGTDIVSGSRYLPGSVEGDAAPADRRTVNEQVTAVINSVTGWGLTDAFCGFKAYKTDALRRVTIDEPGYAMPLEFWARAWRAGLTVCEMPVERIYCDHDRSFGEHLDDPRVRLEYYLKVWNDALASGASEHEAVS